MKSGSSALVKIKAPPCHKGPVEVHPGLWLGDQDEGEEAIIKGIANIAVPLNRMEGYIWNHWDGEIIYIPITDYSVLPPKIAERKARELVEKIKENSIVMFCFGGHGRTGYMAALILGVLGYEDPIAFLRENYCKNAVESDSQIEQIAEILGKPELLRHFPAKTFRSYFGIGDYSYGGVEGCDRCIFRTYNDCAGNNGNKPCKFFVEGGVI